MKIIYKYELPVEREFTIESFNTFLPLSIQVQNGIITMWAEVWTNTGQKKHTLYCYGTGQEIRQQGLQYIGTVQEFPYVWHYYYKP